LLGLISVVKLVRSVEYTMQNLRNTVIGKKGMGKPF